MKHPKIISEIERTHWAITLPALEGLLRAAERELTAEDYKLFHQLDQVKKEALVSDLGERLTDTKHAYANGKTGILFIDGPIIPRASAMTDASGLTSIDGLTRDFQMLEADEKIQHIVMLFDSPGGAVAGVSDFAQMVSMSSKLTTAFIFGQALSAAYWIASAADKIVSVDTGLAGSIGVVLTHTRKVDGVEKREFISSQSPLKHADPDSKEGREAIQQIADDLGDVFVSAVAKNRDVDKDEVLEKYGKGASVVAARALEAGMIDEIQSLDSILTGLNHDITAQAQPRRRDGTVVQTLIFDKKVFPTAASAQKWARDHGFKDGGNPGVDETETSWRIRQRDPGDFVRFRTITLTRGVKAVVGPLKRPARAEENIKLPAVAGNKEGSKMPTTLKEMLAENPAIAAEFEKAIEAAEAKGFQAGLDKAQARIEAAAPYLAEDSVYKAGVRNLALEVLAGKVDAIALQAAVSVLDSQKESEKEIAAKTETEEQGETPPEPPKSESEFDAAAFDAEVAAYRKSRGLEV
jgi:ClpP class serine protease